MRTVQRPPTELPPEIVVQARAISQRRAALAGTVQDLAQLLRLSEANLEKVRQQAWYERALATVTGSNRRLAEVNARNLVEVQRRALQLLTCLAELSDHAAGCIATLQTQVRVLTYENRETRELLLQLARKCSERLQVHERRILDVEQDTRLLKWTSSRYDPAHHAKYDDMSVAKRIIVSTLRFVDICGSPSIANRNAVARHTLLNMLEAAGTRLRERQSLRQFCTDLYEHWLIFVAPAEAADPAFNSLQPLARGDGENDWLPVHTVLVELERFRRTGYGQEHFGAALERIEAAGFNLDEELTNQDFVDLFLEELALFDASSTQSVPRARPTSSARSERREYWHIPPRREQLKIAALAQANAILAMGANDQSQLESLLDLYRLHGAEVIGHAVDIELLMRMAELCTSGTLSAIPAPTLVEHAKRLFRYGRAQTAYEWHAALVDAAPDHGELRNNYGFICLFRGEIERAQHELQRASELGLKTVVHEINLGVAATLLGQLDVAEPHLAAALELPDDGVAAEIVLLATDGLAKQSEMRNVVLTAGSAHAIALCNLGYVLHARNAEGVTRRFDEAIRREKKLSYPLRAAGWHLHARSQHRRASAHFRRAHELEAQHPMNDWERELLPSYYFFTGGRNDMCGCGSGEKFKNCCQRFLE